MLHSRATIYTKQASPLQQHIRQHTSPQVAAWEWDHAQVSVQLRQATHCRVHLPYPPLHSDVLIPCYLPCAQQFWWAPRCRTAPLFVVCAHQCQVSAPAYLRSACWKHAPSDSMAQQGSNVQHAVPGSLVNAVHDTPDMNKSHQTKQYRRCSASHLPMWGACPLWRPALSLSALLSHLWQSPAMCKFAVCQLLVATACALVTEKRARIRYVHAMQLARTGRAWFRAGLVTR